MKSFFPSFLITSILSFNAYSACISYRYRPLFWSPNGQSVVILKQGTGPDGGGSVDLIVASSYSDYTLFKVTSTVRPSGTMSSELISKNDCLAMLKEFNIDLSSLGFQNLLHESTCKDERDYLFNKKVDTATPVDHETQQKILKQLEYTKEASVYGINHRAFIVAQPKPSCSAECFWVLFEPSKNLYQKKEACLRGP